ncbi:MAG: hypothetical protein COY11_00010 [Candidatus Portnoybacteria bacterium CG_4_10_14_0_2_um_filter_44_20]|uniref:DUF2304 domain-containing protein n=1 Tax=Candidatus Portnoybacteria bacterium CG_4_10_14_0_2_um_filter_44_20 TaxID=1974799 RepID=A0A2M7ULV9_9BACT|nr:MAG: hypothetical protein COY11_00010 [Candidatus Portnoybacteria bacterium CG_4_10_14_0_2_um_filter_44_20]
MILGVQIVGVLFALLMGYFAFLNFKRREINRGEFFFWEILWAFFVLIVILPEATYGLIHRLSIARTMDFMTIIGFMFLFFLTYYNYAMLNKIKKKMSDNVRQEALTELEIIEIHEDENPPA